EDAEANRQARAAGGPFEARLVTRARLLAQRDGLLAARRRWRQGAVLAAWLLGIVALFCGAGLAAGALGDGSRPVNVFWALGSLLGLNLLSLAVWAIGLLGGGRQLASPLARLWLWLSGRLARDARALYLGPALVGLLGRTRLLPWALGGLVHGLWLLILGSALATLLA
ncbi:membrane protein, partial [Pseudomonas oryzihabitans]